MSTSYTLATKEFETIIDFIRFGLTEANTKKLFYGHGTDNAWDDLLALILGGLALPLDVDPMLLRSRLTSAEKKHINTLLYKRIQEAVPVPYLLKKAWFCGLSFYVDERVLIPRSPIAELISQLFSPWIDEHRVSNILDLCTGSGCIAIACCYAFPDALVDAVDISAPALEVATLNMHEHGVDDVLTLIQSDCFATVPSKRYDIIVSNPPYVGHEEMQTLPQEYKHEPTIALETDNNGLAIVEKILFQAHDYLTDHGILVVEVGNSEEALTNAYPDVPFTWLEFANGGQGVFILTSKQIKEYFTK